MENFIETLKFNRNYFEEFTYDESLLKHFVIILIDKTEKNKIFWLKTNENIYYCQKIPQLFIEIRKLEIVLYIKKNEEGQILRKAFSISNPMWNLFLKLSNDIIKSNDSINWVIDSMLKDLENL